SGAPAVPGGPGRVATSSPKGCEPATAKTVTSCPSRVSSRLSSQTRPSTLSLPTRSTGVQSVETSPIRMASPLRLCRSPPRPPHQTADPLPRRETFLRDLPRRAAVARIVALDGVHRGQDVVHCPKSEQTLPCR